MVMTNWKRAMISFIFIHTARLRTRSRLAFFHSRTGNNKTNVNAEEARSQRSDKCETFKPNQSKKAAVKQLFWGQRGVVSLCQGSEVELSVIKGYLLERIARLQVRPVRLPSSAHPWQLFLNVKYQVGESRSKRT